MASAEDHAFPFIDLDAYYCHTCGVYLNCCHLNASTLEQTQKKTMLSDALALDGYFIVYSQLGTVEDVNALFTSARSFFRQPIESKMACISLDKARRGYSPLNTDNFASLTGHKKANDTVEKFRMGPPSSADDEYYQNKEGRVHFFPNTWPDRSNDLQATMTQYYHSMEEISRRILRVLEATYELPVDALASSMERHTSIMGLNAYLPLPQDALPSPIMQDGAVSIIERVAEHTDVSLFTIVSDKTFPDDDTLSASPVRLQMYCASSSTWNDIVLPPNYYLVNIGECLQRWSNGRMTPARHRVIQIADSKSPGSALERYSAAFFCSPNYTTRLQWPGDDEHREDYSTWRKSKIKKTLQCIKMAQKAQ